MSIRDGSVASEPWRHRDGAGALRQGGAGGGRGVRHRASTGQDHRDDDRQGAEHLGDRRLVRHRLNGMAALDACNQIKARLIAHAAKHVRGRRTRCAWRAACRSARASSCFVELVHLAYMNRVQLSAAGFYMTPKIHWDRKAGRGHPFYYFAYGAAAESDDRHADRRVQGRARRHAARLSGARSIRRSTSARSKAGSSRAWAG
jgi:hypothetical protein